MGRLYDDDDYETENLLNEINSNLGRQISDELDKKNNRNSYYNKGSEQSIQRNTGRSTINRNTSTERYSNKDDYLNKDIDMDRDSYIGSESNRGGKKGTIKKVLIIVGAIAAALVLAIVFLSNYVLDQINYEPDETVIIDSDGKETVIEDIVPSSKDIINILLIGEEAMADSDRGRSDVMMVLTINQKYDRLVLTSFLRDSYVTPPGYSYGSKMNEVYKKGGPSLLVSTIEQNFQIQIDGYARVNFQSFEEIIDLLGGVEIELTEEEANYLNRTNYISDKKNRNVVPGVQTLNGNQALGYSRIRYVKGINGERDDFGRTNRQRTVINAIFSKYKSKGLIELVTVTNKILPHITTNMTKTDILSYLACAAGMLGSSDLETFRVPMDNAYSGQRINGKAVLVIDFEKVQAALQDEMYGTGYSSENDTTTSGQTQNTKKTVSTKTPSTKTVTSSAIH